MENAPALPLSPELTADILATALEITELEMEAIKGLFTHVASAPLGQMVPSTLPALVGFLTNQDTKGRSFSLVKSTLSTPLKRRVATVFVDRVLGSYARINDVVSVVERAQSAGFMKPFAEGVTLGEGIVDLVLRNSSKPGEFQCDHCGHTSPKPSAELLPGSFKCPECNKLILITE